MPMLIISIIVAAIVAVILRLKSKDGFITGFWGIATCIFLILIGVIITASAPKEYVLIREEKIIPNILRSQQPIEYHIKLRKIADAEFFTEDKNGKIRRYYNISSANLNIDEQERNDGVLRVYKNKSKIYNFFSSLQ